MPERLPQRPARLWSAELTGPDIAGIAATRELVVVPDKTANRKQDVFRCFATATGKPLWTLSYEAEKDLDYTSAPRATPVIDGPRVYLLGALGHLHCVEGKTGRVVWKKHLVDDLGGTLAIWGYTSTPLIVDDLLIVNPGGKQASIVALDRKTGKVMWKTPGAGAAYASFVVGTFGGVRQVVGYDTVSLGGWDPRTGRRLWKIEPKHGGDYNVGTPVPVGGKLLVATENNGTRLFSFGKDGAILPESVVLNDDLAPDSCTPVVAADRVFATGFGELFCLDLNRDLKTIFSTDDEMYYDHTNIIAGKNRLLIWTTTADLLLVQADADKYELLGRVRPLDGDKIETLSHPALVDNRLYLRGDSQLICVELDREEPAR